MDLDEADNGIQTEDQFWDGMSCYLFLHNTADGDSALEDTIKRECATHSHIDDALRSYLELVAGSKGSCIATPRARG